MKCIMRALIASAAAYNMELGFEPDRVEVDLISTDNASILYIWNGRSQQEHATCVTDSTEYGIKIAEGTTTICDTVAKGISLYAGSKTPRVLIEHPLTGKLEPQDVADYTSTLAEAATARSATVIGTILRPTTHNGYVYECSDTSGSAGAAEPTWGTTPGEETVDGALSFTCRKENITAGKGKGITLGETLMATTDLLFVRAYKFDDIVDLGTPT